MIETKLFRTPDGRFAYEAAGNADSPALVFLHGVGGAGRAWRAQLAAFGDRFHAVAWDMPGYGGSAPLRDVSIAALAGALRDFLAAINARATCLVGHSIGGMITQRLLADQPSIARCIALVQTTPVFGSSDGDWQQKFLDARLGPLDRGETLASLAPSIVKSLVAEGADPAGVALARDCIASVPEQIYRATVHSMLGFDMRDALARISVPTLVLSGEKDTNAPAPTMTKMAARIPGAVYVELEGVGHLAGLERTSAFNAALQRFLDAQS